MSPQPVSSDGKTNSPPRSSQARERNRRELRPSMMALVIRRLARVNPSKGTAGGRRPPAVLQSFRFLEAEIHPSAKHRGGIVIGIRDPIALAVFDAEISAGRYAEEGIDIQFGSRVPGGGSEDDRGAF